ncbi:dihydrodipicolinate synthase family protein [Herbiconiux sp. CPCC 203407]|uniref:Dihydrodipicolinate synthase family protein n=1 Tax=Herbiconiux oxytropis TaxID=2970915 RepID=A0AA41XHI9_9MICO|nr:dihydrodipicolinate synthase family protein [Herbiconiux oxytropis]MCS5723795.1 dihydrodipicolinate synthase family protein [Herbiconiux oxytropis]MCS5725890.1 dihydrodipicolinate synthase family protein [Herbiconiux oxytropis]
MFTGLSAFPLTPLVDDTVDLPAFERLVGGLDVAGVDSITALGSTGSYLYLDRDERRLVARAAVESAGATPVMVGIGALRTSQVQRLADDAQEAGAAAVLLAPVSYQPLTGDDVLGLYTDVTAGLSVPLVVYDNPGTTRFTFTDELYARIAALPNVASIKIPPVPADPADAAAHVQRIRALLPEHVTIGVSGDAAAVTGLEAGCDAWYSVIGGLLPEPALAITRGALAGDPAGHEAAAAASARLEPLWQLFREHGSLRVTAALAEHLGLATVPSLPLPLRGLDAAGRARVATFAEMLDADSELATT